MELATSYMNPEKFLVTLTHDDPNFDITQWASDSKETIRQLLNKHGAVLFRGFNIEGIDDFENLATASTTDKWVEYLEATSPRDTVKSNTATSTKYQNDKTIFFHNEKSYSATWPFNLFFYCNVAPTINGETPISDCRAMYKAIPDEIKEKFERKKLMYVRTFSNNVGIPWKKAFNVDSKEELEKYCQKNRIEDLSWKEDGTPVLKYTRDTALIHPVTGDKCWFNHGTFFNVHSLEPEIKAFFLSTFGQEGLPYNTYYGDGEEIEEDVIMTLRGLYEKFCCQFAWQKNDVILIDNMLATHGRRPFEGERSILVTMTEEVNYDDVETF